MFISRDYLDGRKEMKKSCYKSALPNEHVQSVFVTVNTNFEPQLSIILSQKKSMLVTNSPKNLIAHDYFKQYTYSDNKEICADVVS
jgi:hypothetical protein